MDAPGPGAPRDAILSALTWRSGSGGWGGGPAGHSVQLRDDSADAEAEAPGQAQTGSWSRSSHPCWLGFPPQSRPTDVPHTPGPAQSSSDLIWEGQKDEWTGLGFEVTEIQLQTPAWERGKLSSSSTGALVGTPGHAHLWNRRCHHPPHPVHSGPGTGLAIPGAGRPTGGGEDAAVYLPAEGAGKPLQACTTPSPVPSLPAQASSSLFPQPRAQLSMEAQAPGSSSPPTPG